MFHQENFLMIFFLLLIFQRDGPCFCCLGSVGG